MVNDRFSQLKWLYILWKVDLFSVHDMSVEIGSFLIFCEVMSQLIMNNHEPVSTNSGQCYYVGTVIRNTEILNP